jgi:TRAP-type C4-dicarboxylate transport system permease small subunit
MSFAPPPDPGEPPSSAVPRSLAIVVTALDRVASAAMLISGVMMVTLIAIFGWLVFGRYVLNDTPTWVEQLALLLIVWITFIGAAVGVWRSSHLSIDFIREAMPSQPRRALRLAADLLLAVFGGFMAWFGVKLTIGTAQRIVPMLGLSEGWRAAPLAICGALIVVFSLASLALRLAGQRRGAET